MLDLDPALQAILAKRQETPRERSVLVGVTGIDGSGKGYVTARLDAALREQNVRVAAINIDGWLRLPSQRFHAANAAAHFYEQAIRFAEMFAKLVLPLKERRSHSLVAELTDATDTEVYRRHEYLFEDVDVILLDGIFLLQQAYRDYFDLSFWVDCTFETALERALQRGQEGLPPEETIRDYLTIYFPAQRLHLARDNPRAVATAVIPNDPRCHPNVAPPS